MDNNNTYVVVFWLDNNKSQLYNKKDTKDE